VKSNQPPPGFEASERSFSPPPVEQNFVQTQPSEKYQYHDGPFPGRPFSPPPVEQNLAQTQASTSFQGYGGQFVGRPFSLPPVGQNLAQTQASESFQGYGEPFAGRPFSPPPVGQNLAETQASESFQGHGAPFTGRSFSPPPEIYQTQGQQTQAAADYAAGVRAGIQQAEKMMQGHQKKRGHVYSPYPESPEILAQHAERLRRHQAQAKIFQIGTQRSPNNEAHGWYAGEDVVGQTHGMQHNSDGTWSWPPGSAKAAEQACCWQWAEDADGNKFLNFVTEENKTKWYWSEKGHLGYSGAHRRRGTWMRLSPDDWENGNHNLNNNEARPPSSEEDLAQTNGMNYPEDKGSGDDLEWQKGLGEDDSSTKVSGESLAQNVRLFPPSPSVQGAPPKRALIVHKGMGISLDLLKQIVSDTMQLGQSSTLSHRSVAAFNEREEHSSNEPESVLVKVTPPEI